MIRHRTTLEDTSILIAVFLVGLYLTFNYDIFKNSDGVSSMRERSNSMKLCFSAGLWRWGCWPFRCGDTSSRGAKQLSV